MKERESLFLEKRRYHENFSRIAGDLSDIFFEKKNFSDKTDAIQQVLDTSRETLHAEKCALFLVDISKRSLILERASGEVQFSKLKDVGTYNIRNYNCKKLKTGVTPWVWFRKEPFRADTFEELVYNSEGHWKGNWDVAMYGGADRAKSDFKCVYMVPLLAGEDCIGVLKFENRTAGANKQAFDEADERLIDMIGALVTNLVVAQRIERNRYDQILPKIAEVLVSSFGQDSFYERLLEQCRQILSADLCSLFLLDDRDNLVLKAIVGTLSESEHQELSGFSYKNYKRSKGLTPWILKSGKAFNVRNFPDLKARSENHHWGQWDNIIYHEQPEVEFKSLYSIPLIVGDNRIGVLKVENKNVSPFYFTESDESLFDLIGRLIAIGAIYDTEKYMGAMIRAAELGFLAAGISHEFNGALQRLLAIVATARDLSANNHEVLSELSDLRREIHVASDVIKHFRSIRNRQESLDSFDPDVLINEVFDLCRRRFEQHNIELRYENEGVNSLGINSADFQNVLVNLLQNAFESIEEKNLPGIVKVGLRLGPPGHFRLLVEDSGMGIPEGREDHLFQPFFTTKSPSGMGFGLFGVQRIVIANGGEIRVASKNKFDGATFEITLPVQHI